MLKKTSFKQLKLFLSASGDRETAFKEGVMFAMEHAFVDNRGDEPLIDWSKLREKLEKLKAH